LPTPVDALRPRSPIDNERGKGDHRHVAGKEEPYVFTPVEKLIEDFKADVRGVRGES